MSSGDISLQDVQYIGSYNWVDSRQPTIIVPGRYALVPNSIVVN